MSTLSSIFTDRTSWLAQFDKSDETTSQNLAQTTQEPHWDVIVIGGGIVGAGILQEATRRGLTALLIEQKDFAWGTSSRSSKMVHGGLRYIAQGEIKLTKHSLQERERLLKEAPGLVSRMGYYFVLRKQQFPGRFILSALLSIYDWLAGINDHRYLNIEQTLTKFPSLTPQKLKGACYYTDSVVDDSRLVLRVLQESIQAGAEAVNYIKAKTLVKDPHTGQVIGVVVKDNLTEDKLSQKEKLMTLKSSVVINATGAWADILRSEVIDEQRVRPLRGSHLVIEYSKLPIDSALTILHPSDKRPVFIFPWEGTTVVGTTDLDHSDNLSNEAHITQTELDYLLLALSHNFPNNLVTTQDIISTFSGVRPVITADKHGAKQSAKSPSKERRDHAIWANDGLITASGGKLTTFRLSAIEALNAAKPWLTKPTNAEPNSQQDDRVFTYQFDEALFCDEQYDKNWLERMVGRYGKYARTILSQSDHDETNLIEHSQFCLAECRWAIKHESVCHLDDLLLRRTRLGLLLKNGAKVLLPQLAEIFKQELAWDHNKWQAEVVRYNNIWQQYYFLPEVVDNMTDQNHA